MAFSDASVTGGGSKLLEPLGDAIHLQIDEINHVAAQVSCALFGFVYRNHLSPSKVGPTVRHAVECTLGLCILNFCFGWNVLYIVTQSIACYLLMKHLQPGLMEKAVMAVAFGYLLANHIIRQIYGPGGHAICISGPLMFNVLRLTSLAFCLSDGAKDDEKMSPRLKKYAVKKLPTFLEFLSYCVSFQCCLSGPFFFYKDYLAFIEGTNLPLETVNNNNNCKTSHNNKIQTGSLNHVDGKRRHEPSPLKAVCSSMLTAYGFTILSLVFRQYFTSDSLSEPEFFQNTFLFKVVYIIFYNRFVCWKFYFVWKQAHASCASSGLGFEGYDEFGNSKWDLANNISIIKFETATSFKASVEAWNITTTHWVRHSLYERGYGLLSVFIIVAMWHGFYPGYYVATMTAVLAIITAKVVRRNVRPYFQGTATLRTFYDVITWAAVHVTYGYVGVGFTLLGFWDTINTYRSMYFFLHVFCVTVIVMSKVFKFSSHNR